MKQTTSVGYNSNGAPTENAAEAKAENYVEDPADDNAEANGHNAGKGNRAAAAHIKALHNSATVSGQAASLMDGPSIVHAKGAKSR